MCGNFLRQLLIDDMYLLSVNRRSIAMIMSESKQCSVTCFIYTCNSCYAESV